jgi:hypothetical protein
MTHWIRMIGLSALPLIGMLGAAPAFAADPPKHVVATRVAHAKPLAAPVLKTTPAKSKPGSEVMLNPQPIPPGKAATGPVKTNPGSQVMLNPQPIPPGKAATGPEKTNPGSQVMLNPQPIPPGKAAVAPAKLKTMSKAKTASP